MDWARREQAFSNMRDQIVGDRAHFENRIAISDEWRMVVAQGFSQGKGPEWGYRISDTTDQLGRVQALYSLGVSLDEVRAEYSELPELMSRDLPVSPTERYDPARLGGAFNDFQAVVALAALFEDVDGVVLLAEAVERTGMTDFLVDSFIGSLIDFREPSPTLQMEIISNVHGVDPVTRSHEPLKEAAELAATDLDAASVALTKYVSKDWYRLHSWTGWHNLHKSSRAAERYAGYWCFEGAAVAKVFGIDDSQLEGHKYYPWDLVHP